MVVVFAIHWHESAMDYMCSPSRSPLPPPSPSHPSGSSQCTALKQVYYQGWNRSPAQVGCMRHVHLILINGTTTWVPPQLKTSSLPWTPFALSKPQCTTSLVLPIHPQERNSHPLSSSPLLPGPSSRPSVLHSHLPGKSNDDPSPPHSPWGPWWSHCLPMSLASSLSTDNLSLPVPHTPTRWRYMQACPVPRWLPPPGWRLSSSKDPCKAHVRALFSALGTLCHLTGLLAVCAPLTSLHETDKGRKGTQERESWRHRKTDCFLVSILQIYLLQIVFLQSTFQCLQNGNIYPLTQCKNCYFMTMFNMFQCRERVWPCS